MGRGSFRDGGPLAAFKVVAERVLAIAYGKLADLPPPPGYADQASGTVLWTDFTIKRAVEMHRRRLECTAPHNGAMVLRVSQGVSNEACLHEPGQKGKHPMAGEPISGVFPARPVRRVWCHLDRHLIFQIRPRG